MDVGMIRRIQHFTTQDIPVATVAGLEPRIPAPRIFAARADGQASAPASVRAKSFGGGKAFGAKAVRRGGNKPFGKKPFGGGAASAATRSSADRTLIRPRRSARDAHLNLHAEVGVTRAEPGARDRRRLLRIARHADADQRVAAEQVVGRIGGQPAGAGR